MVAPDGKTLAGTSAGDQVCLWDTATGKRSIEWQLPGVVHRLAFSPEGRHLATANANGTVYIFRLGPS
jgi:WD40 repeat protein